MPCTKLATRRTQRHMHGCIGGLAGHTREIQGEGRRGELISRSRGGATDKGNEHTLTVSLETEYIARDVVLIVFAHGHGWMHVLNIQEPYKFYKQADGYTRWMDGRARACWGLGVNRGGNNTVMMPAIISRQILLRRCTAHGLVLQWL
jgi:hypothetical protein